MREKTWIIIFMKMMGVGVVVGFVLMMVHRAVGLRGILEVTTDFHKPALFLSDVKPIPLREDAVKVEGEWLRRVKGGPVFIDVKPLAVFDAMSAKVGFLAGPAVRAVTVGWLQSQYTTEFVVATVFRVLGELGWNGEVKGNYKVYAGDKGVIGSVVKILKGESEDVRGVFALGQSVPIVVGVSGYEPQRAIVKTSVNLRGHHRFLVYADNEALHFGVNAQDMNRDVGADPVIVTLTDAVTGRVIATQVQPDDGNVGTDQKPTGVFEVQVVTSVLPRGTYQVDVLTTDDVFLRDVVTTAQKWVVRERVYLGDVIGFAPRVEATEMSVYGTEMRVRLEHPRAVQKLRVNGVEKVVLDAPFVEQRVALGSGVTSVFSAKDEIVLVTDGVIGLRADAMFVPILPLIGVESRGEDLQGVRAVVVGAMDGAMSDRGEVTVSAPVKDLATAKTGGYRVVVAPTVTEADGVIFAFRDFSVEMTRESEGVFDTLRSFFGLMQRKHEQPYTANFYGKTYAPID